MDSKSLANIELRAINLLKSGHFPFSVRQKYSHTGKLSEKYL
jgi:hypothetical protein